MKPEIYYLLHDSEANLLERKMERINFFFQTQGHYHQSDMEEINCEIGDLRDQINLLTAVLEYTPEDDGEERDYRAEQDYKHTAGWPI